MKKLIIHIGYPKTATTTIQDGLFVGLYNQGIINYLGKSEYNNNEKFMLARNICHDLFINREFNDEENFLADDAANIISEEILTLPSIFREIQWQRKVADSFYFAERLKKYFADKADEIIIIATLRNQQDLIYSLFVEQFPRLIKNEEYIGCKAKNLIFNNNNQFNFELYNIFYFDQVLQQYARCFGKDNVKILLFEDFKLNKKLFIQELSHIIGINSLLIEDLLQDIHFRKKMMAIDGYNITVRKEGLTSYYLKMILKSCFMRGLLENTQGFRKKYYMANNLFSKTVKNTKKSKRTYKIPWLTETQKKIIFNHFRVSNTKLTVEFSVNEEKLRKYGYI